MGRIRTVGQLDLNATPNQLESHLGCLLPIIHVVADGLITESSSKAKAAIILATRLTYQNAYLI